MRIEDDKKTLLKSAPLPSCWSLLFSSDWLNKLLLPAFSLNFLHLFLPQKLNYFLVIMAISGTAVNFAFCLAFRVHGKHPLIVSQSLSQMILASPGLKFQRNIKHTKPWLACTWLSASFWILLCAIMISSLGASCFRLSHIQAMLRAE